MDILIFITHNYLQRHVLFNASIIQVHKMAVCSRSSVDAHTGSVELLCVSCSLHALGGGRNIHATALYT